MLNSSTQISTWAWMSVLLASLAGCASVPQREPLPESLQESAGIPGVPEARFWAEEWPAWSREAVSSLSSAEIRDLYPGIHGTSHSYLAISGGGANGAFGAGLLAGWSAAGSRPEFTMVTGISTGALTAPFAFLGPDYDPVLKRVYTTTRTEDIIRKRAITTALFSESVTDSSPLRSLIEELVDDELIEAIAEEHRQGRQLFIGTMNLDAGREVIWSIGEIAESDYPGKKKLIHDVLLASASIPVAFPPVMIGVEADGESYEEMHVDGGTGSQVFVYPAEIDWGRMLELLEVPEAPDVFVIRNAQIMPEHQVVTPSILSISGRSISSLIRTQGIGDLYRIFAVCQRDGTNFNLAYIPSDFQEEPSEAFDPVYMGKLYDLGYRLGLSGEAWQQEPPGYASTR